MKVAHHFHSLSLTVTVTVISFIFNVDETQARDRTAKQPTPCQTQNDLTTARKAQKLLKFLSKKKKKTNEKVSKQRMAYLLPHLHSGWEVDQAIVSEEDRVVVIRFGHDTDPTCMVQDEVLMSIADKIKNFAVIYLVDITEVPDFNNMYELYDE